MSIQTKEAINALREALEAIYGLCDSIDQLPNIREDKLDMSLRDLLHAEIISYLMYLSASDGRVDYKEADFLGQVFDTLYTPSEVTKLIKEFDLYSVEFERTIPYVLRAFVKCDNLRIQHGQNVEKPTSKLLVSFYKDIGEFFCVYDGCVATEERADMNIFMSNLTTYVSNELKSSNSEKIRKNSNAPANSLKSKYEFLKKKTN